MTTGPTWTGEVVNLAAKGERLELPALVMTDGRYLVLCRRFVSTPPRPLVVRRPDFALPALYTLIEVAP